MDSESGRQKARMTAPTLVERLRLLKRVIPGELARIDQLRSVMGIPVFYAIAPDGNDPIAEAAAEIERLEATIAEQAHIIAQTVAKTRLTECEAERDAAHAESERLIDLLKRAAELLPDAACGALLDAIYARSPQSASEPQENKS